MAARAMIMWVALMATALAYQAARLVARRLHYHPLANIVALAALLLGGALYATATPVQSYLLNVQPLRWMLGPAIVAMALPLWRHRTQIARQSLRLLLVMGAASLTGIWSAVGLAWLLGLPTPLRQALSTKSVTSPYAIALMDQLGGPAALAAGLVIITGIIGAMLLPPLFNLLGLHDPAQRGAGLGAAAHIVGTQRAMLEEKDSGAVAALTMALMGLATVLLLPLMWRFIV
jgi:putative effector of murein hydrolase